MNASYERFIRDALTGFLDERGVGIDEVVSLLNESSHAEPDGPTYLAAMGQVATDILGKDDFRIAHIRPEVHADPELALEILKDAGDSLIVEGNERRDLRIIGYIAYLSGLGVDATVRAGRVSDVIDIAGIVNQGSDSPMRPYTRAMVEEFLSWKIGTAVAACDDPDRMADIADLGDLIVHAPSDMPMLTRMADYAIQGFSGIDLEGMCIEKGVLDRAKVAIGDVRMRMGVLAMEYLIDHSPYSDDPSLSTRHALETNPNLQAGLLMRALHDLGLDPKSAIAWDEVWRRAGVRIDDIDAESAERLGRISHLVVFECTHGEVKGSIDLNKPYTDLLERAEWLGCADTLMDLAGGTSPLICETQAEMGRTGDDALAHRVWQAQGR